MRLGFIGQGRITRLWLLCIGLAIIVIGVLVASGSRRILVREFSTRTPNFVSVALLRPGSRVCEGPVASPRPTDAVAVWGGSVVGSARVRLAVEDAATGHAIASGGIRAQATGEHVARLSRVVPSDRSLRVCVTGELNTFSLLGAAPTDPHVVTSGERRGLQFSLALLNDDRSLFNALPTAFSRASLWRPSWVGSWTFWVLAACLLACFGIGAVAVTGAARADNENDPSRGAEGLSRE